MSSRCDRRIAWRPQSRRARLFPNEAMHLLTHPAVIGVTADGSSQLQEVERSASVELHDEANSGTNGIAYCATSGPTPDESLSDRSAARSIAARQRPLAPTSSTAAGTP